MNRSLNLNPEDFRQEVRLELQQFANLKELCFQPEHRLKIDLHCHDHNSREPDELWGRILGLPETWLSTESLATVLKKNQCDLITVTNHNNADSCWQLLDQGRDVLVGAEFTCTFPEYGIKVHVLAYGFTPRQEEQFKVLRKNVYRFCAYAAEQSIPLILPHPLFFYSGAKQPPLELLEKFALLFRSFEVLNGQRNAWQNYLTLEWARGLKEEKILQLEKKHGISAHYFLEEPYKKVLTGGSDDHLGVLAGYTGSYLSVPNLAQRRQEEPLSALALEAIREGRIAPYGLPGEEERLNLAFLDYFAQVGLNMNDPGLLRMFLHRGEIQDKLFCFGIGNAMMEMRRHNHTMKFLKTFHEALGGKRPGFLLKRGVAKGYRPVMEVLDQLAQEKKKHAIGYQGQIGPLLEKFNQEIHRLLNQRVGEKVKQNLHWDKLQSLSMEDWIQKLEVPSSLRDLFTSEGKTKLESSRGMTPVNLSDLTDGLSFPSLIWMVLAGSSLAATRVLHQNRSFLDKLAEDLQCLKPRKRLLWLTDTFFDHNGVSSVLQLTLAEVRRRNLPIDFLVLDEKMETKDHLIVLRPVAQFTLENFANQAFRVPNLLEAQKIFYDKAYDGVITSTELFMGPVALFLKEAFNVPAYFYMHTDWMDFLARTTDLDIHARDRIRRILRFFYQRFDGIFALNEEHRQWLSSSAMEIPAEKIHTTAHWVSKRFQPQRASKQKLFGVSENTPVLIFAGRMSREKGVFEVVSLYRQLKSRFPDLRLVFAGDGPAKAELEQAVGAAIFLGWVASQDLPLYYSAADLLILPNRFDTFGCVVLEAMSCGLPVAAFDCKGPKDLIQDGVNGVLAEDLPSLTAKVGKLLQEPKQLQNLSEKALRRAADYQPEGIMDRFLADLGYASQTALTERVTLG